MPTSHCGDSPCWDAWALERPGSVVVAHRLSCSAACGVFPDQGSNPYTLNWKADSSFLISFLCFGCVGSWLWRMGSAAVPCGLSCCAVWALLPCSAWDLSSLTGGGTHIPCVGRLTLNHWTTREVLILIILN